MKRMHLIVTGDVIGVGYRAWIRSLGKSFSLTGWVKNREDKTVEIMAEGEDEALERLLAAAKKGPDVSWVEGVRVQWKKGTGEFLDFAVLY